MRKVLITLTLSVIWTAVQTVSASQSDLDKYPETIAVLQLLHRDGVKAARTFSAYARQAHSEERFNVESFFVALSASETIRVEDFAAILREMQIQVPQVEETEAIVASTKLNLKIIAKIESANASRRYPLLIERIKDEGHAVAIASLKHTWKVEEQHCKLAEKILSSLEAFLGIAARVPDEFYVCRTCGSILAEVPDLTCPICEGPISDYEKASAKWQFYSYVENNYLLNEDEKAYAKRMFDSIYAHVYEEQYVEIPPDLMQSEIYQKWGLGPYRDFSLEEKMYLADLPQIAQLWEQYQAVDLDNLSEADSTFLKELHEQYGDGPIDLRQKRLQEKGTLSEEAEKILDTIEIVSGRAAFEDKDLVFLRTCATTAARE